MLGCDCKFFKRKLHAKYHENSFKGTFSPLNDKSYITCYAILIRNHFLHTYGLIRCKCISAPLNFCPFPLSLSIKLNNCWCLYFTFDEQIYRALVTGNVNVATFGFEITHFALKNNYHFSRRRSWNVLHVKTDIKMHTEIERLSMLEILSNIFAKHLRNCSWISRVWRKHLSCYFSVKNLSRGLFKDEWKTEQQKKYFWRSYIMKIFSSFINFTGVYTFHFSHFYDIFVSKTRIFREMEMLINFLCLKSFSFYQK